MVGWLVDPSAALSRAGCGLKTRGGVGWGKFTPRSIDVTTPANENNGSIVWLEESVWWGEGWGRGKGL